MKRKTLHGLGIVLVGLLAARLAWAETLEMVTYYPAPGGGGGGAGGDQHARSLTVGDDYALEAPADGTALISDRLGIGTNAPAGPLHVVGVDDATSNVILMPGADTAAAGTPSVRLGVGTATPATFVHIVGEVPAAQATTALFRLDRTVPGGTAVNGLSAGIRFEVEGTDQTTHFAAGIYGGLSNVAAGSEAGMLRFHVRQPAKGDNEAAISEAMRLTSEGRLGIGTQAPRAMLDVNGDIMGTGAFAVAGGNGDINGDGLLTPVDALTVINYLNGAGLTDVQRARADVTGDGSVTAIDADGILAVINAGGTAPLTPAQQAAARSASDRTLATDMNRNLRIPSGAPAVTVAPNGVNNGNISVNDVFLRSANGGAGAWLSRSDPGVVVVRTGNSIHGGTTYADDEFLRFAVGANQTWQFEFFLRVSVDASGDLKMRLQGPSLAGGGWVSAVGTSLLANAGPMVEQGNYFAGVLNSFADQLLMTNSASHAGQVTIQGVVQTGAAGGNVILQWAARTNSGSAPSMGIGSYLKARRVS